MKADKKPGSAKPGSKTTKAKAISGETGGNPQEAKKLYNEGRKYLLGKGNVQANLEQAFHYFSEAINKQPDMAGAYHFHGRCYFIMGDFQRALYDFSLAIKLDTQQQAEAKTIAEHYNFAGQCHSELGQLDEALKHYEIAVKKDPQNGNYYYNRALIKAKLDKLPEAIEDYNKAIDYLQDTNNIYQARFNKGICLRRLGKLDQSIEDLKKAVEMRNDKASAHNNLGLSYFEKEDFEESLNEFSKAIQLEPHSFHYNNRGLAYYHIGKLEEAKRDYDEAIQRNPEDPFFYFNRGNVYLNQGDFDSAHLDYDKSIQIAPNNPKFWHSKGLAYEGKALEDPNRQDQFLQEKAIEMYKQGLKLSENFISSRFHLGLMYHRTNQFHKALKCFSNVLTKLPEDKTVFIQRGLVYQDMGNHQFAVNDFNLAIKIDPAFSEAYYRRGVSKLKSRRFHEAIEDFKKSLDLDINSENPGVYDGQGCCYHALKDYDLALGFFNTAIEKDPKNINFLMNRAQCYFDQAHYTEAIEDLQSALKVNENDPQVLYKLGLAYYFFNKYKKCIQTLKAALINKPYLTYESDIYYHIGLAYCHLEKFEKAIYPFKRCIEIIPSDIRYIHERAKAYQMLGDHERAIEDFDALIKRNPKNAHAYFRRAFSQKALKNYAQAADDFERAKELDPLNPKMVVNYKKLKGVNCIVLCKPGEEKIF